MNKTVSYLLFLGICLSLAGSAFGMIPVGNPDFEEPVLGEDGYAYLDDIIDSPWLVEDSGGTPYVAWISRGYYASEPSQENQKLVCEEDIIYQTLSSTYLEGGAYVFSTDVLSLDGWGENWVLFFFDATTGDHLNPLFSQSSIDPGQEPVLVVNQWVRRSVTFEISSNLAGHNIGIGLTGDAWTMYDNITVEYDPRGRAMPVAPIDWAYPDLDLLQWERDDPNGPDIGPAPYNVNVYFGTDPNLKEADQIEADYDGGSTGNFAKPLAENTIYYWRVDIIDPNDGSPTVMKGNTWNFITTTPPAIIITETDDGTTVGEQDPGVNNDEFVLTLSKDPGAGVEVEVSFTEVTKYNPLTIGYLALDSWDGEPEAAPDLQVTHSGGTEISSRINASLDNTEEWLFDNMNYAGYPPLHIFYDPDYGGSDQVIGLRFNNVEIPQGATIGSAIVEFEVDEAQDAQVYGVVTGENVDNASAFVEEQFHLQNRLAANPTTAASKFAWTADYAVDDKVQTSDISAVIQEIVNRPGWQSGNSIALILTEDMNPQPDDLEPVATYVLDSSNWDTGVTVTITAVDDEMIEVDPEETTLTTLTSSADSNWDGLSDTEVTVVVLENDCGSWGFSPMDLNKDCVVNIADLAMFASQFELCSDPQYPGLCDDNR